MRRALLLALALAATLAAAFYVKNPMVEGAQRYAASVAASSGAVYLTLRSLNAFLSTAQEIEVGGQFIVSGTAQPLKALEPVDDTIERVAGLVFFVMAATGVLAVAMGPASAVGFGLLALALGIAAMGRARMRNLTLRLGLYGAVLAIALPLSFLTSALLAERMTAEALAEHKAVIARITATVDAPLPSDAGEESWNQWVRGIAGEVERYQVLAGALYAEADALVVSLIGILSVFVFRLLVLPALILGGMLVLFRAVAGRP